MLHTVISTQRSGSNTLCRYLAKKFGAVNLLEPVTDNRDAEGNVDVERVIIDIINQSKHTDIVAKFHVDHLLEIYPSKMDVLINLLKTSKRYYSLRHDFKEQVKSVFAIEQTGICDARFEKQNLTLTSDRAFGISTALVLHISIMGEWFKQFPGKLIILEDMSNVYTEAGFGKYADVYKFEYDTKNTQKFIERDINLMDYFEKGNPLYSLVGA